MEVVVASHPSALAHDTGRTHPERPDRVGAVLRGVADTGLKVDEIESPEVTKRELATVHESGYIEMVEKFCALGGGALDMDTIGSKDTWEAALTAVGGVKATVGVLEGSSDRTGFVAARPPGHHALSDQAMGFCFFNNVAVSALSLRARENKVAILDWDVHHGNGTQAAVADDPGIFYASVHQSPFYPFEGLIGDIDLGAPGTTVNVPLPAGSGGDVIRVAWADVIIPAMSQFEPDWIFVSAGYDGHVSDPLADFRMVSGDYGWIASRIAEAHSPSRIVSVLEGGYDLDALRESTRDSLLGFSGVTPDVEPLASPNAALGALDEVRSAVSRHWSI
jgi:acetoin utilization deacetylase AcuC-like enzyme